MKRIISLIVCTMYLSGVAFAQDNNDLLLNKLVSKNILTEAEAEELRTENKKEETNPVSTTFNKIRQWYDSPYINFGGYGMLLYQYRDMANNHHEFRPRVIFLTMNGQLTNTIGYSIMFEFADPMLYEYYATWTPSKFFNLRAGQFKVPFTFENPLSLTVLETISNTRSLGELAGQAGDPIQQSNGINKTGRDIGIQFSGSLFEGEKHSFVEYVAGVFQGAGMNARENNNTKDFAGTLSFYPIKEFRIGGGLYAGKAVFERGGVMTDQGRNRWTIGAEYKGNRLYARSEWINGNDGGIKKEGLYGTALWYFIPKKANVVGKVDYYNQNKDINSEVIDYTLGLNYYFWERCRFQLNYTYSDYSAKWLTSNDNKNTVQLEMQIVF